MLRKCPSLKQLRYLDVSNCSIKTLPELITSLQNLQTLNLRFCKQLRKLPKGMMHVKNLMYLDIKTCGALRCMDAGMGQLTCLGKLSLFIVGEKIGHCLWELESLNHLGDKLSITNVCNVKDLTDVKRANLMQKTNLQSLSLSWLGNGVVFSNSSVIQENIEMVLDGLQPHLNLKKLRVIGYAGSEFPNRMMNFNLQIPNLVEICLAMCHNCEQLGPFGKLQYLKNLQLRGMDGVKCIGRDVYGDGENPFPSPDTLLLCSVKSLKVWATVTERESFPVLTKLHLFDCPMLVEMPIIPSLERLCLKNVDVKLLRNFKYSHRLTYLQMISIPNLKLVPDGTTLLECLSIKSCDELESLLTDGLCGLSSLRRIHVENCAKFASLSEGVRYLTALEDLDHDGYPELNALPESIQHLTSLQYLRLSCCYGLSCLPNRSGYLTSLSSLFIRDCPNLMSLPDGIQSLTTLKKFIKSCPNLVKRRARERGEDWPKIARIPTIEVN